MALVSSLGYCAIVDIVPVTPSLIIAFPPNLILEISSSDTPTDTTISVLFATTTG